MRVPFIPTSEDNLSDITTSTSEWQYPLDLNQMLLPRPASTFLMRVDASRFGIRRGDLAFVDRSLSPRTGEIVVAVIEGEMRLARFPVDEVWGCVTHIVRSMK